MVGTSGTRLARASPMMANRRARPVSIIGPQPASATIWMWPPNSAVVSSAAPLYGMKLNVVPVSLDRRSMAMRPDPPAPVAP
ncbi:hypothetical protein D3C72_923320 [compost metagenome]